MVRLARADLEKTVASLREDNERLAASNTRLRRDVEERSRLEEEKRRIDAEVAARRVEELTRCAIAAALESTQNDKVNNG
jgi:lipid II:glycine glycyltransferase (peptidoglycan interpeptide bridge formation enzyme)